MTATPNWRALLAWGLGTATVDLVVKTVVLVADPAPGRVVHLAENPGTALGLVSASPRVSLLLSVAVLVIIGGAFVSLFRRGRLPAPVTGLLLGGATANLLDRLATSSVLDWMVIGAFVVNLADLAMLAGAIGYLACLTRVLHQDTGSVARREGRGRLQP